MKIRELTVTLYRNSEVQQLVERVCAAFKSAKINNAALLVLYKLLENAYTQLAQSRGNSKHNLHTEAVAEADRLRDNAFRAFYQLIETYLLCNLKNYKAAAEIINLKLREYVVSPRVFRAKCGNDTLH